MKASPGKRVLILVENLPVPFDRRVWLEAKTLKEAGYKVSIICPKMMQYTKSYEELEGIGIYRYKVYEAKAGVISYFVEFFYCWLRTFFLSLAIALFGGGFDIIHACNPPDTFFLIGLIFKPFGKKFVFDQHDLCPEVYLSKSDQHKKGLAYRLLLLLEKLTYLTANAVISTNQSYRQVALERGKLPEDKVFVVRTGPDLDRFKSYPPQVELKQGKRYLVCYLGTMGPQDGVDYLLRSIDYIVHKQNRQDICFTLIGAGIFFDKMKSQARRLQIEDFVLFTGRIPDDKLMRYISTADVCVCPDPKNPLNDISTMNKTMEYMAMGKPIVAFDLKETRFSAEDAAVYARPNDETDFAKKIIQLLDKPEKREQMGRFGYKRVQESLSWASSRPTLLHLYNAFLS